MRVMQTRHSFLEIRDGLPLLAPAQGRDVSLDSALPILDELNLRPPVSSLGEGYDGDRAWISFLDAPRVIHLYFQPEADRVGYELFYGMNEDLCGVTSFSHSKEAVRLFFAGQSPRQFLEAHSLETYESDT